VESRTAALSMFEGQVPCIMSMADPECLKAALWLAWFDHEENLGHCGDADPWPVCDEHRRMVQMASHPFWRTWHNLQSIPCGKCQTPLRLERVEPLTAGG
jgi:hypothetical protein